MDRDDRVLLNSVNNIDWAQLWHKQMQRTSFRGEGVEFWNNWAKTFPVKNGESVYVREVIKRMHLEPGWSILDVGAGMGTMTLPLARRGYQVTALDSSPDMLDVIARDAAKEGFYNIRLVNVDWTQARVGEDFPEHDVVLVSRSLPAGSDIASSIRLIDKAARRACFITWKVTNYNELELGICDLLGTEYNTFPEYIVLYNLLYSLGIYADVDIFQVESRWKMRSLDEAYIQLVRSRHVENGQMKEKIMAYLEKNLSFQDGYYCKEKKTVWALFSWRK
jgi:SAM-dependent methyltransferase